MTATAQGPGHDPVRLVGCPTCGLAQTVGHLAAGTRAFCSRCDQPLAQRAGDAQGQVALCFSLGALLLFVPANLWPILEVTTLGRTHTYTVASGVEALWHGSMWPLAIPVALASVLLPAALILLLLALSGAVQLGHPPGLPWRRLCGFLRAWAIADVYLLAIFVTVVKLAQLTDAAPALGAALFFAMVVCVVQALRSLDAAIAAAPDPVAPGPLADGGPSPDSASRTLALALGALVLFVPANIFPTLTVTMYGTSQSATVFDGVLDLWQAGMWPLAIIVVCASLLIPFFKIIGLLFLTLTLGHERHRRARTRVYRFIAQIGRWSMLDVYVISLIVAVLHFGALAGARAEIGAIAFVAVVIVTLQAARSFDPRLIWQEPGTDAAGARMGV